MAEAKVDKPYVLVYVIDTIWCNTPQFFDEKVMIQNFSGRLFVAIFMSIILEIPKILLLFAINLEYRFPFGKIFFCCPVDILK